MSSAVPIYKARSALAAGLVNTLADLHGIDPASVGLADFGRPHGYCARQVSRWGEQWRRSHTRGLPDMDVLLNRLSDHVPERSDASIVHGDYRLDNTIVDLDGAPRIAGVLDWELSTLGDPLADLAFSAMKLAVILEGVHARYLGGQTVSEGYEGAGAAVPVLVSKALRELRVLRRA